MNDMEFSIFNKGGEKGSAKGGASAKIGIRDIKVRADISLKKLSVQKAYAAIDSTLAADFQMEGSYTPDSIPLAKVPMSIYG